MNIIIIILALYMVGMLVIGVIGRNKSSTMNEFLTAGKSGGMFVMVCSYIGSQVGNALIVGGAQYGADYGIGGIWYGVGGCLSFLLFALVMSRLLYRRGYVTIPDLIYDRYQSKATSVVMAILNICANIGVVAAQLMAGAALFGALGLNPTLGVILVAIVVFAYSAISGMWGVMMTDSIQTPIIFFSCIFCIIIVAMNGGFDLISAALPAASFDPIPFSADTFIMMLVPKCLYGLVSGACTQRNASCKNEKVAFYAPIIATVALIPFVLIPVALGMYGRALHPDAASRYILFTVLFSDMPPVLAGLMVSAVLSAVMSTIDISLLNITANSVNDIYFKTINPKATQKSLGRLSSIVTLATGVSTLILALQFDNVLDLLSSTYSLMNAGSLIMVAGGIFWKKATKQGAIASAVCGVATIIIEQLGAPIPYISIVSLIPALIAFIAVSLLTQPKQENAG